MEEEQKLLAESYKKWKEKLNLIKYKHKNTNNKNQNENDALMMDALSLFLEEAVPLVEDISKDMEK